MEPKLPTPEAGPHYPQQSPEVLPHSPTPSPEIPTQAGERREQQGETRVPVVSAPSLPAPVVVPSVPSSGASTVPTGSDDTNPILAADEDLIEKEWVDKAKQIIASTRDDPHRREKEVSKLQADYLQKRYGKELGVSE